MAQSRDRHQRISPINLAALSEGLEKVHQAAAGVKGIVHLKYFIYCSINSLEYFIRYNDTRR